MGRASQRKRKRAAAPPAPNARWRLTIAALAAAVLAVSLGAWMLQRGGEDPPRSSESLPDPDTSSMTPPVARAIREAREAALAQPDSAEAVGRLGQVCHAHWLYDAAAACYEIAREIAPEDFRWAYLLAGVEDIRGADGDYVDRLFRSAIGLAPRFPPVYVRHGDALLRLGRWSEARDAYAAAVERDPELAMAHRGLGQAAVQLRDGPDAVEHLERAAALEPEDRVVHVALARAYALVGRPERAKEAASKATILSAEAQLPDPIFFDMESLAVDPKTLRARAELALGRKNLANQLAFRGDFAAALPEFERAARLAPADPEIEHNWATVLMRQGDLQQAEGHFRRAIELNPQSADSLYNLGVVLEGLGRTDEAVESFTQAAAINPKHVAASRLAELSAGSTE